MAQKAVQGGSIAFAELVGIDGGPSPTISGGRKDRAATRVGTIGWTNIDALLLECFPNPPSLPGTYPGVSYLYCDRVEIEPWPAIPPQGHISYASGIAVYTYAKVTIHYQTLQYDPSTMLSWKRSYSVEAIELKSVGLKWSDTGNPIKQEDVKAYKSVPIIEHVITRHRANASLGSTFQTEVGKVNSATWNGAAAETLMFTGAEEDLQVGTAGSIEYTRTIHFKERRAQFAGSVYGWNATLRQEADAAVFAAFTTAAGEKVFPTSANFNALIA